MDEIVVTAKRWGQADSASETELDEDEIASYGAGTIGELVEGLAPLIAGTGKAPAILVNGKRIANPLEVAGYPSEALAHVAILPPDAAARYGFSAGERVVNLELKPRFDNWTADAGLTLPTAGGRYSGQLAVGRTIIDGDTRWNAQAMASDDTALFKSARDIPVRDDVAALLPTLPDGEGERIDPNRFETVVGDARTLNLNAGVAWPLGAYSVSLNGNVSLSRSRQLIGLPIGSIILPPGSRSVSETGEVVTISRLLGDHALQSRQRSESFGVSASLSGMIGEWQTGFSASYSHGRSDNVYDRGYNVSAIQLLVDVDDPAFDPHGPWPAMPLLSDRTRSRTSTLGASLNASKPVLDLPAGQLNANLTVNASHYQTRFVSAAATGAVQRDRSRSDQLDGQWSFTIPVASRMLGVLAPLGDVGLDLSIEAGTATGTRMRRKWHAGVRWVPVPFLDLRTSLGHENAEPTFDQLRGPQIEIVTRVFDFSRQEYAQPISIFGGNPELKGGSIRDLAIGALMRPFAGDLATFNLGYRKRVSRGGIVSFPTLTPNIEAAFPERITRDADGRLLSIDARPINILRDRTESVSSGLTLRYTERSKAPDGVPSGPAGFRPWTFSLTVTHNWQLSSAAMIRPKLQVLDRLRNNGQPRHNITLNLVGGRRGLGASLNGNWSDGARVRPEGNTGGGAEFRYAPVILFNLGLFVEPEQWGAAPENRNGLSGLRFSLDIQNILNGYRKVTILGGVTPRGYTHDEIDPLGRTVRLSIRKQF